MEPPFFLIFFTVVLVFLYLIVKSSVNSSKPLNIHFQSIAFLIFIYQIINID